MQALARNIKVEVHKIHNLHLVLWLFAFWMNMLQTVKVSKDNVYITFVFPK